MGVLPASRVYRRLFVAQVVALLGTGVATVALGLLAYALAGPRAGEVLGTALAIKMVAYVLVSPLVGAVADRVPRRALMVAADMVRIGVVVALPWVGAVWQVYLMVAVLQAASATFTPTFQSVLPDVLPADEDYTAALSASQIAVSLENIVSPLLAAALLLVLDFSSVFGAGAVGFVGSAALVAGTAVPRAVRSDRERWVDRLGVGVRIMVGTPRLRAVLALNLVVAAAGAITLVSTVTVVRDLLGGSVPAVALLLAVSGAGTAAAAVGAPVLLRRWSERRVLVMGAAMCLAGIAGAVALALSPGWALAVAVWATIGLGGGAVQVPVGRVVRSASSVADRPALLAAQFSLSHACWLLTYPLTGLLGTLAGPAAAWSVLGALAVVGALTARRAWGAAVVRHVHAGEPTGHLADAEPHASGWVHTHHVVLDRQHTRWPVQVT